MKNDLKDRLKKYALSAGAVVAGVASSQAQISYTNVNPDDTVTGNGNNYLLDLNNDNVDDFNLFVSSYQSTNTTTFTFTSYSNTYTFTFTSFIDAQLIRATPLNAGNEIKVDSSYFPYALNSGVTVNNGGSWAGYSSQLLAGFASYGSSYYSSSASAGNWIGAQNKYLGLRITVSGSVYYGWARLSVNGFNEFVIKDYAIEQTANTAIVTGDTITEPIQVMPATNLIASDVANSENASDMRIQFSHPANEVGIQQYRAIVVKDTFAANFNLDSAQAVVLPNYITFTTAGTSASQNLFAAQTDSDGDVIVEGVPYRFFVLSVANGTSAQIDSLSAASNLVTLTHPIVPPPVNADTVEAVTLTDIANYGNGKDAQVSFNKADNENKIGEYRLIIVKSANAGSFDLNQAQTLPAGRYTTVIPNGQNVTKVLFETSRDSDGDFITVDVPYRAFVMSLADGFVATAHALSPMSNQVTLNDATGINDVNASTVQLIQHGRMMKLRSADGNAIKQVRILSINGQEVLVQSFNDVAVELNPELSAGVYILEASTATNSIRWKTVVGE